MMDADEDTATALASLNKIVGGDGESPYELLAELRASGPVHEGIPQLGITHNVDGAQPQFTVFGFDAVNEAYAMPEMFSSAVYRELVGQVMGRTIIEMDPPEHRDYRLLLQQSFSRAEMVRWRDQVVEPLLDEMIGHMRPLGRAELVSEILFTYPVRTIATMIGLPADMHPTFHRLAMQLIAMPADYDRAARAGATMAELFAGVLAERRRTPRVDMLSVLAQAEHDGQRLTDEEIFSFLRLLLPAGAETTYRSTGSLLVALFTHPDQLELVRAQPELLPAAVDEALRWETPLLISPRLCAQDIVFHGVAIPAGAGVTLSVASANRDETRWDDPDRFDLSRSRRAHAAFGYKAHMCLGQHLARMESEAIVTALFERLPGLRTDPDAPPPRITGTFMRSPTRLDVVWDT